MLSCVCSVFASFLCFFFFFFFSIFGDDVMLFIGDLMLLPFHKGCHGANIIKWDWLGMGGGGVRACVGGGVERGWV